jgi:hypothetical protein
MECVASHWNRLETLLERLEGRVTEGSLARVREVPAELPPVYEGEFWTARQRAAHSLHEVSYRACFKPQLPKFFIEALTGPGERIFDPFAGRGTTALEAVLLGRRAVTSDLNPLSRILLEPRLDPPSLGAIEEALGRLPREGGPPPPEDLLVFFHPSTLAELAALRAYWMERGEALTPAERWIRMVATNRLTGHSPGFFSVYSMPPNQAVSVASQRKINARREQTPTPREVRALILRKTWALLKDVSPLFPPPHAAEATVHIASAEAVAAVADASVDLIVTSPPFLDVVDYAGDNWLRNWFNGLEVAREDLWVTRRVDHWETLMERAMREMVRVLRPGACVAFEVGEVRKGGVRLEENVARTGRRAGLEPVVILLNTQHFTKTAHCWGVDNQSKGTNTNRIVLFRRP